MSLRSAILTHALPHIPSASFTRQALTASLTRLPKDHADYRSEPLSDEVLDTLYGSERGAERELVARWAEEGVNVVRGPLGAVQNGNGESSSGADIGKGKVVDRIRTRLERRLDFSGDVGEHLVEAYALLASPSSTPAIPIPSLPLPLSALLSLRLPIPYLPPGATALARGASAGGILKGLLQNTGGRIPLLSVNPAGPLGYAWQVADAAILEEERGRVERGVMNEPVGAGPEWYTSRLALSLAYLSAESVLLRPYPQLPPNQVWAPGQPNPHLPLAQQTLTRNMRIYETFRSGVQSTEQGAGAAMGYLEFLGKSLAGVVRSRYW